LYVQHLMGIGHQRRAALIARRLCGRGAEVLYVSGGCPVPGLDPGASRFLQLPASRAADLTYSTLVDDRGQAVTAAWQAARRDELLGAFEAFRPQALLIETFPFGRGLLRFELMPLVEAARSASFAPTLMCSVRDIIEPRSPSRSESIAAAVETYFDQVLVHSDPRVVRFDESFTLTKRISAKLQYTGFVADLSDSAATVGDSEDGVVVSAGGGIVGDSLLNIAMQARAHSRLATCPWRILAGPAVSDLQFEALRARAPTGVCVERNRADFASLLRRCRVSISQAGYNTLLDVVRAGARAVVVPFTDGRHVEQPTRARLFEQRGLVRRVDADNLTAESLAAAVDLAAESEPPSSNALDINGAERTAEIVLATRNVCLAPE
ncbi:MAG TPA: glycosyltransferase, partial [Gammaproteobacteria bacterium]